MTRLPVPPATTATCVRHTAQPIGYQAWHAWAERKARTHRQERCPGCDLWMIWRPKKTRREATGV